MTVTKLLTDWNIADSATGWIGGGAADADTYTQLTSGTTGAVSVKVSAATVYSAYNNGSTVDLSNTHIYIWANCLTAGLLDTYELGGIRIRCAGPTATNYVEWYVAGKNTYSGGWKCFVIDTSKTASATGGTPPNLNAIQHVGIVFKVLGMLSGNFSNCAVDVIRYGSGLQITGGTVGTPLTFDDIITDDNAIANRYGIIRREAGAILVQGQLLFGSTVSGDTYFADTGEIIVFENPMYYLLGSAISVSAISTTLYKFTLQGTSGAAIQMTLGTKQGSGSTALGTAGCIFYTSNVVFQLVFEDADIDVLKLYGCQFTGASTTTLGTTSTAIPGGTAAIELIDCSWVNCGQVTRNISGTPTLLHNNIITGTNTTANLVIADSLGGDGTKMRLIKCDAFTSKDDSVTETITVIDHDFSTNTTSDYWIFVYAKKTWKLVNPVGTIVTSDQTTFKFNANDANSVQELYQLDIYAQTSAGTALQNVYTYVYEGLVNSNLPTDNKQTTNVSGYATSNILKRTFTDNAGTSLTTTTYGSFALRAYKYTYSPFVGSLTPTAKITQTLVLSLDAAITEPTQATAITNGSGITIVEHTTQPLRVIDYDGGTGAINVGDVVTGATSGGSGTVREVIGDTTSGTLVLHTWNGTTFTDNENLQVSAVTKALADTAGFQQSYRWEVRCNSLALTAVYDYLAAKMAEASPDAIFLTAIIWGEDEQTQLMYSTGAGYTTERNVNLTRGVWLSGRGTGTVAYMTSNSGTKYYPPVQYSFTLTGLQAGTEVRMYKTSDDSAIDGVESSGASFSYNYTYAGDIGIYVVVFHLNYRDIRLTGLTLSNANQSIPIQQQTDRVYSNP